MAHTHTAIRDCVNAFRKQYGSEPAWLVRAPGRVNLIGEHVDYNAGWVLPMAIETDVWIAAARHRQPGFAFASTHPQAEAFEFHDTADTTPKWGGYVRGVMAGYLEAAADPPIPPFAAMVHSTIPVGGGLSSSAALEIATAVLLQQIAERKLSNWELIKLCQKAEQRYAGVPCGFMDQFASLVGQKDALLLLDCRKESWQPVPLSDPSVSFVIVNSNVTHELSDGGYATRREQCESAAAKLGVNTLREVEFHDLIKHQSKLTDVEFRRARHVVSENQRTLAAVAAIKANDWAELGKLLYAAHASIRNDFEVSTPELDTLVEIGRKIGIQGGVWGARMTGGGFGGCVVFVVHAPRRKQIQEHILNAYESETGIAATAIRTRPAKGACTVTITS
jgi:galactokinase